MLAISSWLVPEVSTVIATSSKESVDLIDFLSLAVQKILTMIPTEEEKVRIQEAQLANPDVPLGSAEQFLLTLASINALAPRLQLWSFKLNYEATEKVYIYIHHIYMSYKYPKTICFDLMTAPCI